MVSQVIRSAVIFMIVMTVLTGIIYPLVVTGISQVVFHSQANGSLIYEGDKLLIVGYDIEAEIVSDWTDDAKKIVQDDHSLLDQTSVRVVECLLLREWQG